MTVPYIGPIWHLAEDGSTLLEAERTGIHRTVFLCGRRHSYHPDEGPIPDVYFRHYLGTPDNITCEACLLLKFAKDGVARLTDDGP